MASPLLVPRVIAHPSARANRETRPRARRSVVVAASDPRGASDTPRSSEEDASTRRFLVSLAASAAMMFPASAFAEAGQKPPPVREMPGGCTVEALDLFKDTRAKFSLEVGTGALPEAILDLGGCDYSGADLSGKVLSGAIASGANFERANLTGGEMSRAKAIGANFRDAKLVSLNCYEVNFGGSDLRGADFDNAILTNARFGKDDKGNWANLEGVNWDGALLSSSDAQRVCENPTVDDFGKAILGCR